MTYHTEKPRRSGADKAEGKGILKVESIVTSPAESSPLGTHQFLDEFALACHRAVAERLRSEGSAVISHARRNLDRWTNGRQTGPERALALEEWRKILDESDLDKLIEIITDTSEEVQRLRSSSPFAGTLPPEKRLEILAAVNKEQLLDLSERVQELLIRLKRRQFGKHSRIGCRAGRCIECHAGSRRAMISN